jgi:hypothetical protein
MLLILATAMSMLVTDAGPVTSELAAASPAVSSGAKASGDDDPDRVICKNQPVTGSRFIKRICMRRADWDEQVRRADEAKRKFGESAAYNEAAAKQ